jgi:hypothetical protein
VYKKHYVEIFLHIQMIMNSGIYKLEDGKGMQAALV